MHSLTNKNKLFSLVMLVIAIHSMITGILLIVMPDSWFDFFGFNISNRFFPLQGGIFHLVMVIVYIIAAFKPKNAFTPVIISLSAKMMAGIYLLLYYFFAEKITTVLLSGIGDFAMFFMILFSYMSFKNQNPGDQNNHD